MSNSQAVDGKIMRVIKRILLEFGPPAVLAGVWTLWTLGVSSTATEYVKHWSVAFFMASWVWAQILRIIHQQDQKERLGTLGIDLKTVKTTLSDLKEAFDDYSVGKQTPERVSELIITANNQVRTANNAYEIVRSHSFGE